MKSKAEEQLGYRGPSIPDVYDRLRRQLIKNGVANAREFGYSHCDEDNILTDYVYQKLFLGMLRDETNCNLNYVIEKARLNLIKEVESNVRPAA